MGRLELVATWIKSHPLFMIAGALTTVFGMIVTANGVVISTYNALPIVMKAIGRPECLTYARVYYAAEVYFQEFEGKVWREFWRENGEFRFEFDEIQRTPEHIDLRNKTPRPEEPGWPHLYLRLPVCGGKKAKLAIGIEQDWKDFYDIARE